MNPVLDFLLFGLGLYLSMYAGMMLAGAYSSARTIRAAKRYRDLHRTMDEPLRAEWDTQIMEQVNEEFRPKFIRVIEDPIYQMVINLVWVSIIGGALVAVLNPDDLILMTVMGAAGFWIQNQSPSQQPLKHYRSYLKQHAISKRPEPLTGRSRRGFKKARVALLIDGLILLIFDLPQWMQIGGLLVVIIGNLVIHIKLLRDKRRQHLTRYHPAHQKVLVE